MEISKIAFTVAIAKFNDNIPEEIDLLYFEFAETFPEALKVTRKDFGAWFIEISRALPTKENTLKIAKITDGHGFFEPRRLLSKSSYL